MAKNTKKQESIYLDLLSADQKKVDKALADVMQYGNENAILPLIHVLKSNEEEGVQQKVIEILNQLKVKNAADVLIEEAQQSENETIKTQLLSAVWNSGSDASNQVETLVNMAINDSYLVCFECLTIIETIESIPDLDAGEDALERLREQLFIGESPKDDLYEAMQEALERLTIG